jgi:uncharacterized membrane protein YdjX (TVP38/TMEM64 family)
VYVEDYLPRLLAIADMHAADDLRKCGITASDWTSGQRYTVWKMLSSWNADTDVRGNWRQILWGALQSFAGMLLLVTAIVAMGIVVQRYLDIEALRAITENFGFLGPLGFAAIAALRTILYIPLIQPVFLIGLGTLTFGNVAAAVYFLLGSTAGTCLGFLVARYWLVDIAARLKRGRLKRLDEVVSSHNLLSILGLRLVLFSRIPLNFASGTTSISLSNYLLGTLVGLMPTTFIVSHLFERMQDPNRWPALLTSPTVLLVSLWLLLKVVGMCLLIALARKPSRSRL